MPKPIASLDTAGATIILTCGKCARKLDGGFGPKERDTLRGVLRAANRAAAPRPKLRFIETKCLGLCPKRAVVAINTRRPEKIFVISAGTPAEAGLRALLATTP